MSSPGYDTSSTHPPSSPDLCEYTYEGAIQDYKSRVSRAQKSGFANPNNHSEIYPKESNGQAPRKQKSTEIENRLSNFEGTRASNDVEKAENLMKDDLPKVDIARRRELFEKDKITPDKKLDTEKSVNSLCNDFSQAMSIKERLMHLESRNEALESSSTKTDCLSAEFGRVKDRLLDIENGSINQHVQHVEKQAPINVPVTSLKDRLSTLQEIVPAMAEKTSQPNNLSSSVELTSRVDEITNQGLTSTNENMNNNNNLAVETVEEIVNEMENPTATTKELKADETIVNQTQQPVPDVVQEQPNRLLSTINEAIQLVEDQPDDDVVKRDASVSLPHLSVNNVLDNIAVDNDVIDDTSNTNSKSYSVMEHSTSDDNNFVHTSCTDDTTGNKVLISAGESLCTSSDATFSDCNRQQLINGENLNKVNEMYLRCLNTELNMDSVSKVETVKQEDSDVDHLSTVTALESPHTVAAVELISTIKALEPLSTTAVEPVPTVTALEPLSAPSAVQPLSNLTDLEPLSDITVVEPVSTVREVSTELESVSPATRTAEIKLNFVELHPTEHNDQNRLDIGKNSTHNPADYSENLLLVDHNSTTSISEKTTSVDNSTDLTSSPSIAKESIESKNNRIKCQIVGVLEKHKCQPSDAPAPASSRSDLTVNTGLTIDSLPSPMGHQSSSHSPSKSPSLSPYKSPKGIFDFIKRNLLNDSVPVTKDEVHPSNGDEIHSTFYVPLSVDGTIAAEHPPNTHCDDDGTVDESTEINNLIDEELDKLN